MPTPRTNATDRKSRDSAVIVRLHYLFALVTLATIGAGLWLAHSFTQNYAAALAEHREWSEYAYRVTEFDTLLDRLVDTVQETTEANRAGQVKTPVPDVLTARIASLRGDMKGEGAWGHTTVSTILSLLSETENTARSTRAEVMAVLAAAGEKNDQNLHAHRLAMEHGEAAVRKSVLELQKVIKETQDAWLARQAAQGASIVEVNWVIGAVLLVIIAFATLFGRSLQRKFSGMMREAEEQRDAAQAANRAKSDFLAMMSHEIRTPMNGVLGLTSVLLDTDLSSDQRRSASSIRESAESLLTIINDVLDFSKLEAGAMEFEETPFDLNALLNYTAEIVVPRANAKAIDLFIEMHTGLPRYVCSDAGRIRQIALNLLSNAVKFTEKGSVTLRALVRSTRDGKLYLRINVADTGIGIPADRLKRLFKSFSQTDASISRRYGGTGLGLAISKKLAEGLGGSIGVDSTPGKGSTFWFEVPVTLATAEQAAEIGKGVESSRVDGAVATISSLGRPLRVLVAEDNATNQLVVRLVLAKFGITPDFAGNGFEAIEAVKRATYDVILMDVHMPEMDGLEATRAIRAMSGPHARVPIIALTANAFDSDVIHCRVAGMNAHLGKPFRREDLVIALADAVRGGIGFSENAASLARGSMCEAPAIDWNVIEKFRTDSGDQMLRLLIETYLADTAAKLDQLAKLAGDKNAGAEAVRLAHSLKSASAMAGAAALSQSAAQLERTLARDCVEISTAEAAQMKTHFSNYRAALVGRGLAA